jgi:hypothetical protein
VRKLIEKPGETALRPDAPPILIEDAKGSDTQARRERDQQRRPG